MNRSELLAAVGLLVGVPGFVAVVWNEDWSIRALILLLLIGGLVGALWIRRQLDRPKFSHLEIESKLTIEDPAAEIATLESRRKFRANQKDVTEYNWSNISSDGTIDAFLIDGRSPDSIRTVAGLLEVSKRFDPPLHRGEVRNISLTYEVRNAFPASTEYLLQTIEFPTNKLTLKVNLPPGRPCLRARAFLRTGTVRTRELDPPTLSADRLQIVAVFEKPLEAYRYSLDWEWESTTAESR